MDEKLVCFIMILVNQENEENHYVKEVRIEPEKIQVV